MADENIIDAFLQKTLIELEATRKIVSASKLKSYFSFACAVLLTGLGLFLDLLLPGVIAGFIMVVIGGILFWRSLESFATYKYAFKQQLIGAAIKKIDPSLKINGSRGLSRLAFEYSQLFTERSDRYTSEDNITGNSGNTAFSFSEVNAEYKNDVPTKNGTREVWHTIFKGIIFCADFNKNFNGITVVRPKDFGNAVSAWISDQVSFFSSSNSNIVKLENMEFDKTFMTYSSDQVEARYILTPALMERLCELNRRARQTISVSFKGSVVYIAFPLDQNYFEPPLFKSLLTSKSFQNDLFIIRFMYGIIRELDLNTRIWGKV